VSRLKRLIQEIHRRSLWQVLGIYLVGAWVAFQGIEALVSGLGLPEWVPGLTVAILIAGLPIVLATAFVQEGVGVQEAPAEKAGPSEAEGATPPADTGGLQLVLTWRNVALGGVLLIVLAGFVAAGWLLLRGETARPPESIRSIAVLPLDNLSGDPEQQYFADGMTEALIANLGKIASLHVISRTSIMQYRGVHRALPEIARELNVDAIIEGSILRAGDSVRITAQLIDARTDHHLWAESYERDLQDVLALQTDVARAIAAKVEAKLTPEEEARLDGTQLVNPKAYEAYLKGRHYFEKGTASDSRIAAGYFEQAAYEDPGFAPAYAGLADTST
jgi:TolB-like protein